MTDGAQREVRGPASVLDGTDHDTRDLARLKTEPGGQLSDDVLVDSAEPHDDLVVVEARAERADGDLGDQVLLVGVEAVGVAGVDQPVWHLLLSDVGREDGHAGVQRFGTDESDGAAQVGLNQLLESRDLVELRCLVGGRERCEGDLVVAGVAVELRGHGARQSTRGVQSCGANVRVTQ